MQPEHRRDQYGDDRGLHRTTYGALIDDAMGYRDAALRKAIRAIDGARTLPGHYSFTRTLAHVSMLHQRRRDPPAVLRTTEECIQLCDTHGIVQWRSLAAVMRGWARVYLGEANDGIDEMTDGIDAWRSIPMRFALPYFLTLLAEALHDVGRTVEARDAVREAAGKRVQGRDLLRRSREGIAEGADTLDLVQARNVLESLACDGVSEEA